MTDGVKLDPSWISLPGAAERWSDGVHIIDLGTCIAMLRGTPANEPRHAETLGEARSLLGTATYAVMARLQIIGVVYRIGDDWYAATWEELEHLAQRVDAARRRVRRSWDERQDGIPCETTQEAAGLLAALEHTNRHGVSGT